jgi:hypothetical protein
MFEGGLSIKLGFMKLVGEEFAEWFDDEVRASVDHHYHHQKEKF